MTLLAPGWAFLGVAAALAAVALHLLALGRPAPLVLPTARFVPPRSARARRLARRPTDLVLLAVRAGAMLLGGLALARPTRTPTRRPVARVIVADRGAASAARDSVRALAARGVVGAGDLLIAFDTSARAPHALGPTAAARDSVIAAALGTGSAQAAGALSAALAAARRAAPRLRDGADSLELVIVSPLTTAEVDAATTAVRAAWAGRARVVRVVRVAPSDRVAGDAGAPVRVVWRRGAVDDDALAAAVALGAGSRARDRSHQGGRPPLLPGSRAADSTSASIQRTAGPIERAPVVIVRDGPTAADSALARDSAAVLVDWPAAGVPNGWRPRARPDTVGAVAAGAAAFVAPLARRAEWTSDRSTRVVARWADGAPAAVERAAGAGCVRAVAVPVPQVGDAALRAPFRALLAELTRPCAHRFAGAPLDSARVRSLAGAGPLLATRALGDAPAPADPLARWLLAAALALLVAELPLRLVGRRQTSAHADAPAGDVRTEAAA